MHIFATLSFLEALAPKIECRGIRYSPDLNTSWYCSLRRLNGRTSVWLLHDKLPCLVDRDCLHFFSEIFPTLPCQQGRWQHGRYTHALELSETDYKTFCTAVQILLSLGNVRESRPSLPNLAMRVTALETATLVVFVPPYCYSLSSSPYLNYEWSRNQDLIGVTNVEGTSGMKSLKGRFDPEPAFVVQLKVTEYCGLNSAGLW